MGNKQKDEEEITSSLDIRIGFIQKYGVKGVAVLVLSMATPYIGTMLDNYNNDSVVRAVKSQVAPIKAELARLTNLVANCKGGVVALRATDIDYIARMAVKAQSVDKVKEIKELLYKHQGELLTDGQKIRLTLQIKQVLITNSKVYVKALNSYQHHAIGRIGDYIWNTFPMDEFLHNTYDIAVYTSCSNPDNVGTDLMLYMLEIQDSFFKEMYYKMLEKEK